MKRIAALSALIALAVASQATLISVWDFRNNNLNVNYNPNGLAVGAPGQGSLNLLGGGTASFASTTVGTFTKNVLHLGSADYLQVAHGVPANDGGAYTNTYSVMIDIKQSTAAGFGLLNSGYDDYNGQEAAIRSTGKGVVGGNVSNTAGGTEGTNVVNATSWTRYVVVRRGVGPAYQMDIYANGALIVTGASEGRDGGPSLYSPISDAGNPYAIIGGHNSMGTGATADVSAIAWFDQGLTQAEVSSLGPVGSAVPEPGAFVILGFAVSGLMLKRRQGRK